MAIEKGLYSAPMGLDDEMEDQFEGEMSDGELEIEIIDPEAVILDDGSMEITLIPDVETADMADFNANLAEFMDEGDLRELSQDLVGLIELGFRGRSAVARIAHRSAPGHGGQLTGLQIEPADTVIGHLGDVERIFRPDFHAEGSADVRPRGGAGVAVVFRLPGATDGLDGAGGCG